MKIGDETKNGNGLTTGGLGMKIGVALRNILCSKAEKEIMLKSITASLGMQSIIPQSSPMSPPQIKLSRAPFVTPHKLIENPVNFDGEIFFTALEDGLTPMNPSTASTHKCRARNDVNAALNRHGTLEHQAAIIHDICTVGPKAGIGVTLGILDNPEQHASVVEHLFQDTFEVLHCDRVIGKDNTQAIEFTHNKFLATAPTAPPENATGEEEKAYREKFMKYCDEM
jgi:hypothetical protein